MDFRTVTSARVGYENSTRSNSSAPESLVNGVSYSAHQHATEFRVYTFGGTDGARCRLADDVSRPAMDPPINVVYNTKESNSPTVISPD